MTVKDTIAKLVDHHRRGLITDFELAREIERAHLDNCTGCIECLDERN